MSTLADFQLICDKYCLKETILDTPDTKVFTVTDGAGQKYAVKLTDVNETEESARFFSDEIAVFTALTDGRISFGRTSNGRTPEGFPNVYFIGKHRDEYNAIVMDMLSPDLRELSLQKTLSVPSYQNLACEMLECLMVLYQHGFTHCDVKPHNFMLDNRRKVHLIDFGLSKRFRDPMTKEHFPLQEEEFFSGTALYSSINAHNMIIQSRRDDLVSLRYSLIEMTKEHFPWENVHSGEDDSGTDPEELITKAKEKTSLTNLCKYKVGERYLSCRNLAVVAVSVFIGSEKQRSVEFSN